MIASLVLEHIDLLSELRSSKSIMRGTNRKLGSRGLQIRGGGAAGDLLCPGSSDELGFSEDLIYLCSLGDDHLSSGFDHLRLLVQNPDGCLELLDSGEHFLRLLWRGEEELSLKLLLVFGVFADEALHDIGQLTSTVRGGWLLASPPIGGHGKKVV